MRRSVIGFALAVFSLGAFTSNAQAIALSDIDFWVGQGSNQAVLIFDWNDAKNPEALAWGYRWDGTKTVANMLHDIAGVTQLRAETSGAFIADFTGADPRLYLRMSQFGFGDSIFGVGYDLDGDGGTFTSGTEGFATETGAASDADDHYREGFFSGFWNSSTSTDGVFFDFNAFAVPGFDLVNGTFYAWSFDSDFTFDDVPQADIEAAQPGATQSATPEPGSVVLLVMGAMGLMTRRRAE